MAINFSISACCAWQQSAEPTQWSSSANISHSESPDVSAIPAMLRRRLSVLGRAAASQILAVLSEGDNPAIVYCCRHGDLERTLGVLKDLAADDPVSPMNFSLTVHNAVPGILSIHTGITASISSIASGNEGLIPTLLEAIGQLSEDCPKVICLISDAPPPPIYQQDDAETERTYACCFVVQLPQAENNDTTQNLALNAAGSEGKPTTKPQGANQALNFAAFLDSDKGNFEATHNGSKWLIQKSISQH